MHAKIGDVLKAGQPLVTLFSEDAALLDMPEQMLRNTLLISEQPAQRAPLIREVITV